MLLTDILNQWQLLLEREIRGEKLDLEPGYAKFYEEWKKMKEEMLHTLSPAERVEHFSDDVGYEAQRIMEHLISKRWTSSDEKMRLKSEAEHGDLCLVSTDEGKHFDKVLSTEELIPLDPLKVRYFSPTLQSTTNNPEQIKEDQNLLCVAKTLRANHCLVERGCVDNHVVHVDIVHQKMEACTVEVDLNKPSANRLFVFTAKDGSRKEVIDSQLPELFGVATPPISLEVVTPLNAVYLTSRKNDEKNANINADTAAVIATYSSIVALHELGKRATDQAKALSEWNQIQNRPKDKSDIARVGMARELLLDNASVLQDAAGKFTTNVMESKAAVAARILENQQKQQVEKENYIKAVKAHEIAQRKMWAKQQEDRAKQKSLHSQAQKARKVVAAVGSAVTGGAIGGFGFLGYWIAHINQLNSN